MNWRYKALAQWGFSFLPAGDRLNYLAQTRLTRNLPFSAAYLIHDLMPIAQAHIGAVQRKVQRPLADLSFYEFGAGVHLSLPLLYWCLGVQRQMVTDLRPLANLSLVNHTIELLRNAGPDFGLPCVPQQTLRSESFEADLQNHYGICYRAPFDARDTGLPYGSIDCITTTSTLEHIPQRDLARVLTECARILAPDGIASMIIDYKDHYSYFDGDLSSYNFLRYSSRQWLLYNPPLQYQNRLRHSDYLTLARGADLAVIEEHRVDGSEENRQEILGLGVDYQFESLQLSDLAVRESHLVLKRAAHAVPTCASL